MKRQIAVVSGGAFLLFLAGWGASDIIRAKRIVITDMRTDEARVSFGTDSMGNGHLVVKDWKGNVTFEVRGNEVTMPGLGPAGAVSPPPAPPQSGRVMTVQIVEVITGDANKLLRAEMLLAEAVEIASAAEKASKAARDLKVPSNSPYRDRYGRITDRRAHDKWVSDRTREVKRQRQDLNTESAKLKIDAKHKRREAKTLEDEANERVQVITGYEGNRTIILRSQRDLRQHMNKIVPGVCLSWTGNLLETDVLIETWTIRSVQVVVCP